MTDTHAFAPFEWLLAMRYLRARRKEGFISVIAGFSFLGIMLGVATLIIVMAVMTVLMSTGAAVRTKALLAVSQVTQEKQQQRFELALRWRGLTEANASRVQGGLAANDMAVTDALKADIARTTDTISEVQKQLEALADDDADKAAMAQALLQKVWPLLESGQVKPYIFKVFELSEAAQAHALMESSAHIGKIMMKVGG